MRLSLNQNDVSKFVQRLQKEVTRKVLPAIATEEIDLQNKRNEKGVDSDGVKFKKYTPPYAKYGREALGYSKNPVTLERTGGYRKAKYYDKANQVITVKPKYEKIAEGLSKKRKHLKANEGDIPKLEKVGAKALEEAMNG